MHIFILSIHNFDEKLNCLTKINFYCLLIRCKITVSVYVTVLCKILGIVAIHGTLDKVSKLFIHGTLDKVSKLLSIAHLTKVNELLQVFFSVTFSFVRFVRKIFSESTCQII